MNNMNISRRSLLALGLNGAAVLALAGCGGGGEAPAPAPAPDGGEAASDTALDAEAFDACVASGPVAPSSDIMASEYIKTKKPDFFTFYYGALDNAGHTYGWYGPEYIECLKGLDRGVGMVIQALKDAGIFEDTIIIMSSDHGGKDKGHGGFTMLELETPFIVFGRKVKKGFEFPEPMMQYDTAATIAYILGLDIPDDWRGRPLKQIFK